MTDYADPRRSTERLSDAERETAVRQLAAARDEGRLRPDEFDQRAASARAAVSRGDLAPLFSDLPAPADAPATPFANAAAPGATPYPGGASSPGAYDDQARSSGYRGGTRALGGAVGATIMAIVPFAALALFFLTGYAGGWAWAWLWFLLVPLAGIIIYGPGADQRGRDRR
ncbi:MAG: DUF1707 domain-containing protein [Leifsonia sp.]